MKRLLSYKTSSKIKPYLFISPFYIWYAVIGIYPLLYGLWLGFMKQKSTNEMVYVGFDNYAKLIRDERFWKAMINTVEYTCGSLFVILPIALLVALALKSKAVEKIKGVVSSILFSPNVTSVLVVSIVFGYLLKTQDGVINALLESIGIKPIKFLFDTRWAIPSIIIMGTWRYVGINSLYFLAGLQNIPEEIIEASTIDGATPWRRFWSITLPMLKPVMTFIVFQAIVGSFGIFGEPYLLSKVSGGNIGGINDSMLFPTVYMYIKAFRESNFGYGAAVGYMLSVFILLVTLVQLQLFREKD